jgi:Protein of unknown function (DUF4229)
MRAFMVYNGARLGLFLVALVVLDQIGVSGLLLFALALVISGIASYVLLSGLRDKMSESVEGRMRRARAKAGEIRGRIEEGTRAEDDAPASEASRSAGVRPRA